MKSWLQTEGVRSASARGDWPSPDLADLWKRFQTEVLSSQLDVWEVANVPLRFKGPWQRRSERLFRIESLDDGRTMAYTADYDLIGELDQDVGPGLVYGEWRQGIGMGIRVGPSA